MTIKITDKLMKYLERNHSGQHCPLYWVLSRSIVQVKNKNNSIEISEWEYNAIPNKYLVTL